MSDPVPPPQDPAEKKPRNTVSIQAPTRHTTSVDNVAVRLGMVLQLSQRARRASPEELPYIIANETRQLLPYRQAAFWQMEGGKPRLKSLSGLAAIDRNSPYVIWINRFANWRLQQASGVDASLAQLAAGKNAPAWLGEWQEWVPEHVLDVPLYGPGGWVCGYICLFREKTFYAAEADLFGHVAATYGDSLGGAMMRPKRRMAKMGLWRFVGLLVALAVIVSMFIPQPQSVLAQAEVAPRRPVLIRAGVDGVIEEILVEANQRVYKGDALLRLDDTQLRTRLAVAEKAEEMARVELRQLQQSALHDPKSKARLPLAQGRAEQLVAEKEYIQTLLDRVTAASPMDGVALVDNPDEWLGRPVNLGQRIMMVADPRDVMLEMYLPIADAMPLSEGDELLFFPNVNPTSPVKATIVFVGYRAVETPGLGMAFRVRADFEEETLPMLGLRGMARIGGKPLPLGLIVLRRPIMAVRQWLGW